MQSTLRRGAAALRSFVAIVPMLAGVAGCAGDPFSGGTVDALRTRTTTTAAQQLFDETIFEKIDLVELIDPNNPDRKPIKDRPLVDGEFERALDRFYQMSADGESRRNRVVDRVMMASEQRCTLYKNYLKRVETFQGFFTGVITTVMGAAGGISTVPNTSRFFSGLAGISSGVGAELKHDFFADVASQVIVPGIDQKRELIERTIRGRFGEPISRYTLEGALQDAARYHGACSLLAGLQQAGVSIREVRNPGLLAVNDTLRQLSVTKILLNSPGDALDPASVVNQPLASAAFTAGAAGPGFSYASDTPTSRLLGAKAEALAVLDRLAAKATEVKEVLDKDPTAGGANRRTLLDELGKLLPYSTEMATNRKEVEEKITTLSNDYAKATDDLSKLADVLRRAKPEERAEKALMLAQAERKFDSEKYLVLRISVEKLRAEVGKALSAVEAKNHGEIASALLKITAAAKLP